MYSPSMSLPSAITSGWWSPRVDGSVSTSASRTISRSTLGTSMPTADLPGMGASIRTLSVATAYAMFFCSAVIFSTLTPGPSSTS